MDFKTLDFSFILAQAAAAPSGAGGGDFAQMLFFLAMMGVLGYFMLYRPMQKEKKQRQELIESLGKGDKVVTAGGIHGVIVETGKKDTAVVEIAKNTRITINKGSLSVVNPKGAGGSKPDAKDKDSSKDHTKEPAEDSKPASGAKKKAAAS
ncbi:MAG: preprotein translocase subunit YajC [Sumerlaeia bacterium]